MADRRATKQGGIIDDVLQEGLRAVFCGTALGAASARVGAYYAATGNKFWPTLHRVGLTSGQIAPTDYRRILEFDLGLTDLCKLRSGSDRVVGDHAFDVPRLLSQLEAFRPAWLAFNGKKAAKAALALERVHYGAQTIELAGVRTYVLPSTSGAASGYWDIAPWREFASLTANSTS